MFNNSIIISITFNVQQNYEFYLLHKGLKSDHSTLSAFADNI